MKRIIYILLAVFSINASFGQVDTMRASISLAGNPSNIRVWLLPLATKTPCVFSTLQFNVAIPSSITPAPTLSVVSTAFGTVPPASWIVDPPYIENGFLNYNIYTAASGYSLNTTAGVEFQAMELSFTGGPGGGAPSYVNTAHLVTLPDGGVGGTNQGLFYCTGSLFSNGQQLYYPRTGTTVVNGDSYTSRLNNQQRPAGTFTSFVRLDGAIALPVKYTSFFAYRTDNNGMLNWSVENQDLNMSHFEIERSFDGSSFTRVGRTEINRSTSNGNYQFADANLFDTYKGTVYYRIKLVNRSGEALYTSIRSIKADGSGFMLNLYPNPVVKEANLAFTLNSAKQVSILLTDASGKRYVEINMQAQKGLNQKSIDVSALSAGTYMFRIVAGDESQTLSFVKSN